VCFIQYFSEDELGQDIVAFGEKGTGEKSDIPWALLQNGASMNRTSIGILPCPHTPISRWVFP
jgi:hypothetical protein